MVDPRTVLDALIACCVDTVWMKLRLRLGHFFDDLFSSCMDLIFQELEDHFKTYFDLTAVAPGQIRHGPGRHGDRRACIHWTRDSRR